MTTILSEKKLSRVCKIHIIQDSDPISPFEEDACFGEVIFRSKLGYGVGHKIVSDEEVRDLFEEHCKTSLYLPLYAYIHSGISLSTSKSNYPFTCPWDTSYAGFIHIPFTKVRTEYNVKKITKAIKEKAYSVLESEIKMYNQLLSGDVYGFITKNIQGDELDSCWGFYGTNPMSNGMSEHIAEEYHPLLIAAANNIEY